MKTIELSPKRSFIADLNLRDLQRLREVCRRVFREKCNGRSLTNTQCDKWIESMGPKVMEKRIKIAVDTKMVE